MTTQRTDAEYEAMADDIEAGNWRSVGPIEVYPERLRNGRPAAGQGRGGNTPSISVRFPADLRRALDERAAADQAPVAEVIRRAVADYVTKRPA